MGAHKGKKTITFASIEILMHMTMDNKNPFKNYSADAPKLQPQVASQQPELSLYDQAEQLLQAGDSLKALQLYQQAAQQGDVEAVFRLGQIFEFGMVGNPDMAGARKLYELAAGKGHALAARRLEELSVSQPQAPSPVPQPIQPQPQYQPQSQAPVQQPVTESATASALPKRFIGMLVCLLAVGAVAYGIYTFMVQKNGDNASTDVVATETPATIGDENRSTATSEPRVVTNVEASETTVEEEPTVPTADYVLPYFGSNRSAGVALSTAAGQGGFVGTYRGMKASALKGFDVKKTSDNTLQVMGADGYQYLFVFDRPVVSAANPSPDATLSGVAVSVRSAHLVDDCNDFDANLVANGAVETATPHLYRLSDGNFASAGYTSKNNRFWVYYYYPNSPTRDEAAPRR